MMQGKQCGIVNMLTKMSRARVVLCVLATRLRTALFNLEFEVFVWRDSPYIPKKLIVPYGTITFRSLKDNIIVIRKYQKVKQFVTLPQGYFHPRLLVRLVCQENRSEILVESNKR